jgi:hypothetical protein
MLLNEIPCFSAALTAGATFSGSKKRVSVELRNNQPMSLVQKNHFVGKSHDLLLSQSQVMDNERRLFNVVTVHRVDSR